MNYEEAIIFLRDYSSVHGIDLDDLEYYSRNQIIAYAEFLQEREENNVVTANDLFDDFVKHVKAI